MKVLPRSAEVVVIGGGVIGLSIAFHLADAGVRNVVVVERDLVGQGSSAKPLGGVRATFSDPGNIMLGQRSLEAFEQFRADIGLRQVGYLFLCRTEDSVAQVEASTALQRSLGGSGRMVSPAEAVALNPFLNGDALLAASFSPRDGYAEPGRVVAAYRAAAVELGVRVIERAEVLGIDRTGAHINSVATTRGAIRTSRVICAAGAWSAPIGDMVGVPLPVEPVRRQIGVTPDEPGLPTVPFTLDLATTMYFHNSGEGLLLGISNPEQAPGFGRDFSLEWQPSFDRAASVVAPSLVGRTFASGWAGLYENTPDHNALIGASALIPGFSYATGFSGHGFLQAPAVGEVVRDLFLGREPFLDPAPFHADRFAESAPVREVHII
ncbi:NAD(P)/FAD-dependent oxidoreductase [Glycomyces rhizosphaerae]|uniref:NAD(P)/FAD-dependent oxidoreductase n=1 Tax=Glycomyces rhizosphaerae TaxID=2054422 RepID=A0ABV7PZF3_9ACTN